MTTEKIKTDIGRKSGAGLKIYYIMLTIVTAVILVLSFASYYFFTPSGFTSVDSNEVSANAVTLSGYQRNALEEGNYYEINNSGYAKTINEIDGMLGSVNGLTKVLSRRASEAVDKTAAIQKITATLGAGPTYTIQDFSQSNIDYTLDRASFKAMGDDLEYLGRENKLYSRQIKNFIIDIPGESVDSDAVLLMTHFDSEIGSYGATGAAGVAAMIGTIKSIVESNTTFKNELVFVITDGRYENSIGAYAFRYQFSGFNNVNSRIKAAINFDAITAGGSLALVQSSLPNMEVPGDIIGEISNSFSGIRNDTLVPQFLDKSFRADSKIFYDYSQDLWTVPSADIMTVAGTYKAGSQYDTIDNIDIDNICMQYSVAMEAIANHFGNIDLPLGGLVLGSGNTWLGLGLSVSGLWMIILAVLLLLLSIGSIVIGTKSGVINPIELVKGIGLVLLAALGAAGIEYGLYFLISLLVSAFGGYTMNQVFTSSVVSPLVIIPALLLNVALSFGFYTIFKRLLHIKAKDCVRGASYLVSIAGIFMGFAFSRMAFALVIVGIVYNIITIVISLLKKTDVQNLGKLFLYFAATVLFLPFAIQALLTICNFYAAVYLPLMLMPISIMLATITPYFSKLTPALEDLFEKLPKHTIVVQREVVTRVEDEAKKGKFEEVKQTVVENEKVAWKYHTWFGVTALSTIALVAIIICQTISAFAMPIGVNSTYSYSDLNNGIEHTIYDDAIVCTRTVGFSSYKWTIRDDAVYRRLRYLKGYEYWEWKYDETKNEYTRTINTGNAPSANTVLTLESVDGVHSLEVTPEMGNASQVFLTFINLARDNSILVEKDGETYFSYSIDNPAKECKLALPYGFGNCKVTIKSDSSITIKSSEYITSENAINNDAYERIEDMRNYFSGIGIDDIQFNYIIESTK